MAPEQPPQLMETSNLYWWSAILSSRVLKIQDSRGDQGKSGRQRLQSRTTEVLQISTRSVDVGARVVLTGLVGSQIDQRAKPFLLLYTRSEVRISRKQPA